MTDPTGRSFISYRRARADEVREVVLAHLDHGVPVWQDVRHLDEGPTEDQLREIIRDPTTANGVLWLTPDVDDSPMIKKVEAPELLKRTRVGDAFFLVPVAAGGLDYAEAAALFEGIYPAGELAHWNLARAEPDPVAAGTQTARRVLRRRIAAVSKGASLDEPIRIRLFTRDEAPFEIGTALALDWRHRFDGRVASEESWNMLLPALREVSDSIQHLAPGRPVRADGLASLSAALALGAAFPATRGIPLEWVQRRAGHPDQAWSLGAAPEASGFVARIQAGSLNATELAVLVCIAEDVGPSVSATPALPTFRAVIRVERPGSPPHFFSSAGQAHDAALQVISAIREARRTYTGLRGVHLFLAAPVGFAVLLGQLLNTLGPVRSYEHIPSDPAGSYVEGPLITVG